MRYEDVEDGQLVILRDNMRVGREVAIQNLTVGKVYVVVRKSAPDGITIVNDAGRNVALKVFRFDAQLLPAPAPVPLWLDDIDLEEPAPKGLRWEAGTKIRMNNSPADWFYMNPPILNAGYVPRIMDDLRGTVCTIKEILQRKPNQLGERFTIEEAEYTYNAEWFELADGKVPKQYKAQPIAPKPKYKYKKGDVVTVEKKAGDWIAEMDETIGDTFVIALIAADGGYVSGNGFNYVAESLRLATEEEKKLAKATLLRQAQQDNIPVMKKGAGGVSSFCLFKDAIGGVIKANNTFAGICHAALGYQEAGIIVGVTDYLYPYETQVNKDQHADYKAYVDYIINRSPWHIASHKMSVDRALKEGLHYRVEKISGKILGAACVALRMGKEFASSRLPIYTKVVNAGYEEAVAFLVQHAFTQDDGGVSLSIGTGAHTVLDPNTAIGPVVSLMRFGYDESSLKEDNYVNRSVYRGFTSQLSDQKDYLNIGESFSALVRKHAMGVVGKGQGFAVRTAYSDKDVFSLADAFTKLFHKLDVMEF